VSLQVRQLAVGDGPHLADLFGAFSRADYDRFFHPHAFDSETAYGIASYAGLDYFCCGWNSQLAVAYGMLRGFDAGFAVPSLGIAVHPDYRSAGIAKLVMEHLHDAARARGATSIRLKVYPENQAARSLYARLDYIFGKEIEQGQLVGIRLL
jgi:[ribosomal protein S18]-alanine N-acetyltransferase